MVKRGLLFTFLFLLFLLPSVKANPTFSVVDDSGTLNFVVGNTTANYTIRLNLTSNESVGNISVRLTFPYGIVNLTACNSTAINMTNFVCNLNFSSNASFRQANFTMRLNISAFNTYGANEFSYVANCTQNCQQNSSARNYTVVKQSLNPRPDATLPVNTSLIFTKWQQSESDYDQMFPIYAFDATVGRPVLANNTFGDIIYFGGKSFFEFPDFMKLYSYNLTFIINSTSPGTLTFRSPINGSLQNNEGMLPLFVQTFETTDFFANTTRNFTNAFPNANQFSVWRNGVLYNSTSLSSLGAAFSWNAITNDQSSSLFTVNVTNTSFAVAEWTVMATLSNISACAGGSCARSPLFVNSQQLSGWGFEDPPKFGETINITYTVNVTNSLQNHTLGNLRLAFMQPMNVTMVDASTNTTKQFNMTIAPQLLLWNGTAYNSSAAVTTRESSANFVDNFNESPGRGNNITIYITTFYLNLSAISGWNPGSNALARFTANMTFPVLDEAANTPGTSGTSNSYNATVNSPQEAPVNLTDKLPGLDANAQNVVVIVDGVALNSSNYTLGSLTINSLGSGTHTISVSYSVPSSSSSSSSSSSGGGGGGGTSGGNAIGGGSLSSARTAGYIWDSLALGQTATWDIKNPSIDFVSLQFELIQKLSSPQIQAAVLGALPKGITAFDGTLTQYVQINVYKFTNLDVEDITINFKVLESWLADNGFVYEDIALFRYNGKSWDQLSTKFSRSDGKYAYHQASSPAFSLFAIGTKKAPTKPSVKEEQAPPATETTATPTAPAPAKPAKKTTNTDKIVAAVIIVAIVVGLCSVLFRRKK